MRPNDARRLYVDITEKLNVLIGIKIPWAEQLKGRTTLYFVRKGSLSNSLLAPNASKRLSLNGERRLQWQLGMGP